MVQAGEIVGLVQKEKHLEAVVNIVETVQLENQFVLHDKSIDYPYRYDTFCRGIALRLSNP